MGVEVTLSLASENVGLGVGKVPILKFILSCMICILGWRSGAYALIRISLVFHTPASHPVLKNLNGRIAYIQQDVRLANAHILRNERQATP